jgi:hypothetical protein
VPATASVENSHRGIPFNAWLGVAVISVEAEFGELGLRLPNAGTTDAEYQRVVGGVAIGAELTQGGK